jgi:ribosome-associated toxin RatA of RatAB toxin-antitoxin module
MYTQEYNIDLDYEIDRIFEIFEDLSVYRDLLSNLKIFKILKKIELLSEKKIKYDAYIELSYMFFKLNYNCEIIFNKNLYKIFINGHGGSFEFINASWVLKSISEKKTNISYKIEFQLKSSIQQKIAHKILDLNSERIRFKLINALEKKLRN